jgi:hypothetical protein
MNQIHHILKEPILFTEKDYINLEKDKDFVPPTQKIKSSNPFEKSIYDYIEKQINLTGEKLKIKKFEILKHIINIDTDIDAPSIVNIVETSATGVATLGATGVVNGATGVATVGSTLGATVGATVGATGVVSGATGVV